MDINLFTPKCNTLLIYAKPSLFGYVDYTSLIIREQDLTLLEP